MPRHIHVIGLDDAYLEELKSIRHAEDHVFHPLIPYSMIVSPPSYPMEEIMATARRELDSAPAVDAIIGHWDFPTTSILPILRAEYGLPSPTLESVLYCENKYWSRLAMRDAAPESTPAFQHIDPFDEDPWGRVELDCPFWIKPNVAFSSYLGFRVDDARDFRDAIERIREGIGRFAEPFEYIARHVGNGSALPEVGSGGTCVAEAIVSGELCTLEGFVQEGRTVVYGILDSLRGPNQVSFVCYRTPSRLPSQVRQRMVECAERVVARIGLNDTPFNMELFWDRVLDRVWLLEINPRISKSHCAIFRLISGASHHEVAVDVALGRRPDFPRKEGAFPMAAKFMPRTYEDARVTRVPARADIRRLQERYPELIVHSHVAEGMRLSELRDQDSYSFEIADVFLGGTSEEELHAKFREVMNELDFRFSASVETNYQ